MKKIISGLCLFASVVNLSAAPTESELNNMTKIVGYFPNWGVYAGHRNFYVKDIRYDKLTHINVAFAAVDSNTNQPKSPDDWADFQNPYGEIWGSKYSGNYGQLAKFKEQYPHISVLISIGGWTLSSQFPVIAADSVKRKQFAENAVKFMKQNNFDGIDIDWEFPTNVRQPDKIDLQSDEGNPYAKPEDKSNFTLFLKDLRDALTAQSKLDNRYYQLTTAIGSSEALINGTNPNDYSQYVDFINIMSYDMHGAWEDRTNHQSPIYSNPNLPDDKITLEHAVDVLISKGVPAKKLVGGSPFYSRGWKGVECGNNVTVNYVDENYAPKSKTVQNQIIKNKDGSNLTGLYCYASGGAKGLWDGGRAAGVNAWYDVVKVLENDSSFIKYRDQYSKVPYLYSSSKQEFYTYEDEVSAQERAQFIKDKGMGGIIFWELSADTRIDKGDADKSLLTAIYNKLYDTGKDVKDNVASVSTTPIFDPLLDDVKSKQITDAKSSGELPSTNTIKDYSSSYYPLNESYGPHYNTGEQVIDRDAGKTYECTAKWWVNAKPVLNGIVNSAWDCKEINQATVPQKLDDTEKAKTAAKAEEIAKKLASGDNSADSSTAREVADYTNKNDTNTIPILPTETNVDETVLTPEQIKAAEDELAKCQSGKVYNTGDVCTDGVNWYKFKWWTLYSGNFETSMEITTNSNKPSIAVIPANGIQKWSNGAVYSKQGIRVVFEGFVFESKYWTSGNKPEKFNDNNPWKYIGIANFSATASDSLSVPSAQDILDGKTKASSTEPIVAATDEKATTSTYDPKNGKSVTTEGVDSEAKNAEIADNLSKNSVVTGLVFRPFVDAVSWPPYNPMESGAFDAGIKHYAFAFINSNGSTCSPRWGSYDSYTIDNNTLNIQKRITEVTKNGGTAMVSFGGAIAGGTELPQICATSDDLAMAYKEVIDKLGTKLLDYDIEGENAYKQTNVLKRMKALRKLQLMPGYEDVKISFTLAVMPTGLLADSGIMILKTALQEKVKINMVNLMLMDYGEAFPADTRNGYKMSAYSIMAIESLNIQLKDLLNIVDYPRKNDNYYHLIGAIPMIGRNDTLNEWFYPEDIVKLTNYAKEKSLGMLSMWSLNRDLPLSIGESSTSELYKTTKLPESDYKSSFANASKFGYSKELLKGEQK